MHPLLYLLPIDGRDILVGVVVVVVLYLLPIARWQHQIDKEKNQP